MSEENTPEEVANEAPAQAPAKKKAAPKKKASAPASKPLEPETAADSEFQYDLSPEAEFAALKRRAKLMGLRISNNIGLDTLRQKVKDAIEGKREDNVLNDPEARSKLTKQQLETKIREQQRQEQMRLVRVRIACLNPDKAEWTGEIFTVNTKYLGDVRKMIPFGEATDDGYHIPYILYQELKNRKFLQKRTTRNARTGVNDVNTRLVPEFSIEVLPPLTVQELADLKAQQGAAAGL